MSRAGVLGCLLVCVAQLLGLMVPQQPDPMQSAMDVSPDVEPRAQKFLLVAIPSAPQNRAKRDAIRESWMSFKRIPGVQINFFIGQVVNNSALQQELLAEQVTTNDVVSLEMDESYYNLTLKTLSMVRYASENGFEGIVKTDDDTFLRVDLLVDILSRQPDLHSTMMGRIKSAVVPFAEPTHKWYMRDQFNETYYPDYLAGPIYYLGRSVIEYLSAMVNPTNYRLEDVAIGIYTRSANFSRVALHANIYMNGCESEAVAVNSIEPDEQRALWFNLHRYGDICVNHWRPLVCTQTPCMCYPLPVGVESCN
eukprot:c46075_g1_i1.p1 GENE.c46075_g1_i1~~c46075_g1_i1.p1  ORF type:complete len:309 (-),score=49.97 c46075_g1_i1:359-1285(-)